MAKKKLRGGLITNDLKAIVYRHAADGELYVHGFGPEGDRVRLEDLPDGIAIHRLPRKVTNSQAIANDDGTVTLQSRDGKDIWGRY